MGGERRIGVRAHNRLPWTRKTIRARSSRREKTFLGDGDKTVGAPVSRGRGVGAVRNNSFVFERSRSTDFHAGNNRNACSSRIIAWRMPIMTAVAAKLGIRDE